MIYRWPPFFIRGAFLGSMVRYAERKFKTTSSDIDRINNVFGDFFINVETIIVIKSGLLLHPAL